MRHYHWTAAEARDRAARLVAEAGRRDHGADVYAAIGRGREALIRLAALRDGRPVPLGLLTPEELARPPHQSSAGFTHERFHWHGKGDADFFLDRPLPHRAVLYEAKVISGSFYLRLMERTDQRIIQREERFLYSSGGSPRVAGLAGPDITHVKIAENNGNQWTFELIDPTRLPPLEDMTRGTGDALLRHELGAVPVVVQCDAATHLRIYVDCDCARHCKKPEHLSPQQIKRFDGESRIEVVLPKDRGAIEITTTGRWSIDFAPRRDRGR